jgi:hypothetical protein
VHRDIKTDNVLFDEHGNAVVADFGIARAVVNYAKQTGTNMVVGTPQYFAPEQARGQVLDGRADIYALGVTLYRAATGTLPFNGEDWYEIARQHVETKPDKPRTLNAGLSRDIQAVILRCLEKEPADRFATGEEMVEALEAIQYERGPSTGARTQIMPQLERGSGPSAAPPPSPVARGRRTAIAATLVFGAIAAGGIALASREQKMPLLPDTSVVAPESLAVAGSVAAPLPLDARRKLTLVAPASAQLFVNGAAVGTGTWTADTLAAAEYEVVAALREQSGCPTVRVTQRVALTDVEPRTVRLSPRGCAPVELDINAPDATYALVPVGGGQAVRGKVGDAPPLVPEGSYTLRVTAPGCADFSSPERIGRERRRVRVRMLCG